MNYSYSESGSYQQRKRARREEQPQTTQKKGGFWEGVLNFGRGVVKGIGGIAHMGHKVTEVVDELGLGDWARAVVPGYGLVDKGLDFADNLYTKSQKALDIGEQVYDNSQWVANRLGVGAEDYRSDLSFNDRIARGLQTTHGYSEDEARSMMTNYQNQAYNTLRDTGVRIYNEHEAALSEFRNDAKASWLSRPMFEGGQHVFPVHGQTLVQGLSNTLDRFQGSRGVYDPNLPYNLYDKINSGIQTYGQSMMGSLRDTMYGQTTPSELYSTWSQAGEGVADAVGSAYSYQRY